MSDSRVNSKQAFKETGYSVLTDCVTAGYNPDEHNHAANPPIYLTSTFEFDTAQDCASAFEGRNSLSIYSRLGNPTTSIVEKKIAILEHAEDCVVTASGMGAIASTMWTFLKSGDVVLASDKIYGCTYALFAHTLTRFGITVEFVDMTNHDDIRTMFLKYDGNIRMLYTETILNPSNEVVDLDFLYQLAARFHFLFVVDNTFASPLGCNPLDYGADIVIHSATKYLLGGMYTAGAVCGQTPLIQQIRMVGLKDCTGAVLSAELSFLMYEMIQTLDVRFRRMSDNAKKLAEYLEKSPRIEKVVSTALESHPQYQMCVKQLKIPNPLLTIYLKGNYYDCAEFMNKLKLCLRAVSLGKNDTLIDHPASMTHSTYSPAERQKYGITDNMIRISVGLEDIDDVIADFAQALGEDAPAQ